MSFGLAKSAGTTLCIATLALAALAHASQDAVQPDISPRLLIETGPSDNPDYRRMVFVKYLGQDGVTVAYAAYNRSEFIQIEDETPKTLITACQTGRAATLEEIEAYQQSETERRDAGEPPAIAHFCIKNVADWEAGNKSTYLDPIFEGLPHAATFNN